MCPMPFISNAFRRILFFSPAGVYPYGPDEVLTVFFFVLSSLAGFEKGMLFFTFFFPCFLLDLEILYIANSCCILAVPAHLILLILFKKVI